jgi:hypothetical protein
LPIQPCIAIQVYAGEGKLASKKLVGTKGDTKVFEGEAASEKQES